MTRRHLCILTVLLIGLLPVQAASFRYSGQHFTTVMYPYTSDYSVYGTFNLAARLEPNRPPSAITPLSFSFSDGIQTLTNRNSTILIFEIGTDRRGNVERWVIQLVANSCLLEGACGIVTVHTLVSGDGGQIIVPIATTVQGYVKDRPGVWTSDTTFNPFGVSP